MSIQRNQKHKVESLFSYLLLLTGFFLLLEIGFFIMCNRVYLSDYTFVSDNLQIPLSILPSIFTYLFVQLTMHLAFCIAAWIIAILSVTYFEIPNRQQLLYALCVWFVLLATVLSANQYYFPNSKFSRLTSLLMLNDYQAGLIYSFCLTMLILVSLPAVLAFSQMVLTGKRVLAGCSLIVILCVGYWIGVSNSRVLPTTSATAHRPNIFLIGVDSLRPDFLSFMGGDYATPFLDELLNQSVVLTDAVTPLARTFPSWMGILTGLYPKEIGVRTNLTNLAGKQFPNSLPAILQRHGYETIYATDESRFSNMDKQIGFDKIYTPPMGLNDFLLGSFNDFPLMNLIVNSKVGRWLLPYSYANRAVYFTYDPDTFVSRLRDVVLQPRDKPLFLVTHFCLPHHPYIYSNFNGEGSTPQERYVVSILRVDQQIKAYYSILKNTGLLTHSIVVLLSDHGEALEFPGDRITEASFYQPSNKVPPKFYPPSDDNMSMNQSAGHGTDVLGIPQYHSLLAFSVQGLSVKLTPKTLSGVVSLLDIKPTILGLLRIESNESSGISLSTALLDNSSQLPERHIFLESDFSPEAVRTVYPEIRKVMLAGIDLFVIDPVTTRLTVKPSMVNKIINSKQYADIYGEWMLALYPQSDRMRLPILVNLHSGRWTDDLTSSFALASPATDMLSALYGFYGAEIGNLKRSS